jgi:hypothetical protein
MHSRPVSEHLTRPSGVSFGLSTGSLRRQPTPSQDANPDYSPEMIKLASVIV